jgi:hypothetical protein
VTRCSQPTCQRPAAWHITNRSGLRYEAAACHPHLPDELAEAKRRGHPQPHIAPIDQPSAQYGRQDDLFGGNT